MAREWQLLAPGWVPGQGYSVVEFYDPLRGPWVLVDPQHAGIIRDKTNETLDMKTVIKYYVEGKVRGCLHHYGPYTQAMYKMTEPTTEDYFFRTRGFRSVLH